MDRSTALALLDRITEPNVDGALSTIEEQGAGAIRALLGLHEVVHELCEAQEALSEQILAVVQPEVDEDSWSDVASAIQLVTDCGRLDAVLSRLCSAVQYWTDDDGYLFDSALGTVSDYVSHIR